MTEATPVIDHEPTPAEPPSVETGAGPWLAVLAGVALLLALFITLALIASSRPLTALP